MSDLIFGMLLSFGINSSPRVLKNNGLLGERVILGVLAGLYCAIIFAYPHSKSGLSDLIFAFGLLSIGISSDYAILINSISEAYHNA